jgi:hypothetical protein
MQNGSAISLLSLHNNKLFIQVTVVLQCSSDAAHLKIADIRHRYECPNFYKYGAFLKDQLGPFWELLAKNPMRRWTLSSPSCESRKCADVVVENKIACKH